MQSANPTVYNDVSVDDFNRFKTAAKARGMNVSGNVEDTTYDLIPIHIEYKPDQKQLTFTVKEPVWMVPGTMTGILHNLVAQSTGWQAVPRSNENPIITGDHSQAEKIRLANEQNAQVHPATVTRTTPAPVVAATK
jgi:hypothetical protein